MCNLMQIKYVVINDHWLGFLGVDILGSHLNAIINIWTLLLHLSICKWGKVDLMIVLHVKL